MHTCDLYAQAYEKRVQVNWFSQSTSQAVVTTIWEHMPSICYARIDKKLVLKPMKSQNINLCSVDN